MILPDGFGLSIPHQNAESDQDFYDRALGEFNPSCFYNHKRDLVYDNYFRMLWRVGWVYDQLKSILDTPDDGKIWFLGNEPHSPSQCDESPQDFANAVKFWKQEVGRPFGVAGILWGTHGYYWWKSYLSFDPPKPDAYLVHIYAYSDTDFDQQLIQAKSIFNDKPLIITECGGWNLRPEEQIKIQSRVYAAIATNQIHSAFWFSARYGPYQSYWFTTDCLTKNESVTAVGRGYKQWSSKESNTIYLPIVIG